MNKQDDMLIEVDRNGEFQLPKEIMARHGWGPGSRLLLAEMPDGLRLKAFPKDTTAKLADQTPDPGFIQTCFPIGR